MAVTVHMGAVAVPMGMLMDQVDPEQQVLVLDYFPKGPSAATLVFGKNDRPVGDVPRNGKIVRGGDDRLAAAVQFAPAARSARPGSGGPARSSARRGAARPGPWRGLKRWPPFSSGRRKAYGAPGRAISHVERSQQFLDRVR